MSGNQLGTIIGAAVGYFVPGFSVAIGASIGGVAGSLLMPDKAGIQDQEGPRLSNLKVTNSTYGVPVKRVFGSNRIGGSLIWAKDIKETKHVTEEEVGKGGSETYDVITYSYSIDMAIALCEGPITSINKIWAGGLLIFDAAQGGYTQSFLTSEYDSGQITRYLGVSDQDPNWLMQADDPNTPGYRNIAYLVFHNFQLEKFGNHIPNITAEVVKAYGGLKKIVWQEPFYPSSNRQEGSIKATQQDTFMFIKQRDKLPPGMTLDVGVFDVDNYGMATLRAQTKFFPVGIGYVNALNLFDADRPLCGYYNNTGANQHNKVFVDYEGESHVFTTVQEITAGVEWYVYGDYLFFRLQGYINPTHPLHQWNGNMYRVKWDGNKFNHTGSSYDINVEEPFMPIDSLPFDATDIYRVRMHGDLIYYITNIGESQSSSGTVYIYNMSDGSLSREIILDANIYMTGGGISGGVLLFPENDKTYYIGNPSTLVQIDYNGKRIRDIPGLVEDDDGYFYATTMGNFPYNIFIEDGILTTISGNEIYWPDDGASGTKSYGAFITAYNLNAGGEVTLASIVQELSLSSGMELSELELSGGLSEGVQGFTVDNTGSARSAIAALQSAYLFDLYEDEFRLKLKVRGDYPVKQITDFVLYDNKSKIQIVKKLQTELPKSITLAYSSYNIDYQNGSQMVERSEGSSDNNILVEVPVVIGDNRAKQLVEKLMFSAWSGSTTINFDIPFDKDLSLCDMVEIIDDDFSYICRVDGIEWNATGTMSCSAVVQSNGTYESDAEGSDVSAGFNPSPSDKAGQARFIPFNAPTLDNSIVNSFGIYVAATGQREAIWRGCNVYKSIDAASYTAQDVILSSIPLGYTTDILGDAKSTLWDFDNTVNVYLLSDAALESVTQEQLLSSSVNYIMIGSEILQYRIATLESDGSFTLSELLRGRRGTEWATGTHDVNEDFIYLKPNVIFSYAAYNLSRDYKAVSFGYDIESSPSKSLTYDGTNLTPLSPSALTVQGTVISWMRRDRYITGYFNTIKNSESQEKYKIEFFYLDVSQGFEEVTDTTTYTYDELTYPDVDKIQVSQFSDNIMNYGYTAEVLI